MSDETPKNKPDNKKVLARTFSVNHKDNPNPGQASYQIDESFFSSEKPILDLLRGIVQDDFISHSFRNYIQEIISVVDVSEQDWLTLYRKMIEAHEQVHVVQENNYGILSTIESPENLPPNDVFKIKVLHEIDALIGGFKELASDSNIDQKHLTQMFVFPLFRVFSLKQDVELFTLNSSIAGLIESPNSVRITAYLSILLGKEIGDFTEKPITQSDVDAAINKIGELISGKTNISELCTQGKSEQARYNLLKALPKD